MFRRQFLQKAATLVGAGLVPWGCGSIDQSALGAPGLSGWEILARSLQGTLLFPGGNDFDAVSAPWNMRYLGQKPAAVARCLSNRDVQTCILWAQSQGVPLVARAGGHSYTGYSLTTGLMIDVSLMNQISFEPTSGLARLGGGARNRDVYAALRAPSVSLTHGRCKAVGVAGLVLGGGIGFNMRARGLTCDQLIETEVVTAQGQILVCNAQQNSDLFWACRGAGGGNFGIHTSFTFQTFPVSTVTYFNLTWTSSQRAVFDALNQILMTAPNRLGCKLQLLQQPGQPLKVVLLGQLVGSPAEVTAILAPVTAIAAPNGPIQELAYWDAQELLSEAGDPEFSHERSRYAFQPLVSQAVDTIFGFLERWPGTSVGANWKYFLQGGAVAAVAPEDTAFVHRAALFISSIELEWSASDSASQVETNSIWLDQFHAAMLPFTSKHCYQNFIDDSQTDFLRAYYGSNLERLVKVKAAVDPGNVFHYPQSIPVNLG